MAAAVSVLAGYPAAQGAQQESDEARRLRDAAAVFDEIMAAEDKAIPRALLGKADGIAIFPSTVRAGFILGGMRGRGVLSARTDSGWSEVRLYKGSILPVARWSPYSLYSEALVSFDTAAQGYDPQKARGFIDIQATEQQAQMRQKRTLE